MFLTGEWVMSINGMMKKCCGEDGKPDFEKMKLFMQSCGKEHFSEDDNQRMHQFCSQEGKPDPEKMKLCMEKCGCGTL